VVHAKSIEPAKGTQARLATIQNATTENEARKAERSMRTNFVELELIPNATDHELYVQLLASVDKQKSTLALCTVCNTSPMARRSRQLESKVDGYIC